MAGLGKQQSEQLKSTLQSAVIQCSERCLYQSAKWAAEMSTSLPSSADFTPDTEIDSPMEDVQDQDLPVSSLMSPNADPEEARLEAQELPRYLLAKAFFDCREFDRCAAVFLPANLPRGPLSTASPSYKNYIPPVSVKGKAKDLGTTKAPNLPPPNALPYLSQKSLFLSLYARYMSGEKRKDEESEMILGPADGGSTVNKELVGLGRHLEGWFADREARGISGSNQGWLEYLYGIVLVKGKSEEEAKRWLLSSVHLFPYNWSAWLELSELLGSAEEVSSVLGNDETILTTYISCKESSLSYRRIS